MNYFIKFKEVAYLSKNTVVMLYWQNCTVPGKSYGTNDLVFSLNYIVINTNQTVKGTKHYMTMWWKNVVSIVEESWLQKKGIIIADFEAYFSYSIDFHKII